MVTGHAPTNIMEPLKESSYKSTTSPNLIKAIQKAMQVDIKNRFSTIDELKNEVLNNISNSIDSDIDTTTILSNNDKTQLLDESSKTSNPNTVKKIRRFNVKKAAIIIGLIVFTIISIKSLFAFFNSNTSSAKSNEVIKEVPAPSPSSESKKNSEVQVDKTPKEQVVEGILKKSTPTKITELKDDDHGKEKDKKKDENEKIYTYQLSTAASVVKNQDFTIKLTRLDFIKDYTIAYCYIENNTNKNLALNYNINTYLLNKEGEKILPITSVSTDLSNIKSKAIINNAVIYFKGSNLDEGKLVLRTFIDFNDKLYNNNINLIVNIK
jgi:hypothetical protein